MFSGIWAAIKAVCVFLGIVDRTQQLKNTPAMVDRDQARKENEAVDEEFKIIKNKDEQEIINRLS